MENKSEIIAANYCVSFVDLLGQRAEYKNESLLPNFITEKEKEIFYEKIKKTIKPIYALQKDASKFIESALSYEGPIKKNMPKELDTTYDEIDRIELNEQRWSDGLFYFVSLHEENLKCPLGSIFTLLGTVGTLCFIGLARKQPIRGSIDIAWGVELLPGELYGAVLARAYELESIVAQYPRIVIGEKTIEYLNLTIKNNKTDIYAEFNRYLAQICLNMTSVDFDGYHILDYLGQGFEENIATVMYEDIFKLAFSFVNEQLTLWEKEGNTKLSTRYQHLHSYFSKHEKQKQ